jgi:hypothetical protein
MRLIRHALGTVGLAVLTLPACSSDPTEPERVVNPELAELRVEPQALRIGGALVVYGVPADLSFEMRSNERLQITVTTSDSDQETLELSSLVCHDDAGNRFVCNEFVFGVSESSQVDQLAPLVEQLPARIGYVSLNHRDASVRLLSGELDQAMRRATLWPDVVYVQRNPVGTLTGTNFLQSGFASGALAVDAGTHRSGDSRLQVSSGTRLTLTYQQPTGESLSAEVVVP